MHGGQGCAITTRMLLPASRYDEGVEMLEAVVRGLPVRRPDGPRQHHGSADQRSRSASVSSATSRRARPKGPSSSSAAGVPAAPQPKGCFVEPTLFVDVDPDATIAQEEIFGPVLAVLKYEDDDDAVRIANNSTYGLSGSVASASLDRALRHRPTDPDGHGVGQRRRVVRARLAVRWLQGQWHRTRARASRASRSTSRSRPSDCRPTRLRRHSHDPKLR